MVDLAGFQLLGRAQERAGPALLPCKPCVLPSPALEQGSGTHCAARQGHTQTQELCVPWSLVTVTLEWPGWLSLRFHPSTQRNHDMPQCPQASSTHSEGSVAGCR